MDLAILSSRIFTADARRPWAQALHVAGNTITCVGRNDDVRPHIGNRTEVLELPGRLITPGIVDAHTHFISLGLSYQWVDLNNLESLQACRDKIRQAADILGNGLSGGHGIFTGEVASGTGLESQQMA